MKRERLRFETKMIPLSKIHNPPGVFICERKVVRFADEYKGTLAASTETEADCTANTAFVSRLILAMTHVARIAAIRQDQTLKKAVASQGMVELIHYASGHLTFRLTNPNSLKTWSLEDVLADLVEAAEFYNLQNFLDNVLEMAGK